MHFQTSVLLLVPLGNWNFNDTKVSSTHDGLEFRVPTLLCTRSLPHARRDDLDRIINTVTLYEKSSYWSARNSAQVRHINDLNPAGRLSSKFSWHKFTMMHNQQSSVNSSGIHSSPWWRIRMRLLGPVCYLQYLYDSACVKQTVALAGHDAESGSQAERKHQGGGRN